MCMSCGRSCGVMDIRCSDCQGCAHRRCLLLPASSFANGWFNCVSCTLAAAGLRQDQQQGPVGNLVSSWIGLSSRAVGESSAATYATARQRYLRFCVEIAGVEEHNVFPRNRGTDINHRLVCLFITYAARMMAKSTVEGTISALADWQRSRGLSPSLSISTDQLVKRTLMQAFRCRGENLRPVSSVPREKMALSLELLSELLGWSQSRAAAEPGSRPERVQDACWLVLGFFGMLRRSELAALRVRDVQLISGGGVVLWIRSSKTDQQGVGASVCLAETSNSGFPVGAFVRQHVEGIQASGAGGDQPLVSRGARWTGGIGLGWRREAFTQRLRCILSEMAAAQHPTSIDVAQISAHSLRRGGATAAYEAGVPLEAIMRHGRWRSSAVLTYVRESVRVRMEVVQSM